MSATTEDVAEGIKQLWEAATALSDPGSGLVRSLIYGRATNAAESPYASFTVRDGQVKHSAQTAYLQTFTVEFRTWTDGDEAAVNGGEIKAAIEAAFTIRERTVLTLASGRQLAILHSLKTPGGLEQDQATTQSKAAMISTDRYELLVQG